MLTRDGVIARFIWCLCFYFVSATGMVHGGVASICGILATVLLTSALLHYSPLVEFLTIRAEKMQRKKN
jgi:hypothetical protein